jgi:hypothetical protein
MRTSLFLLLIVLAGGAYGAVAGIILDVQGKGMLVEGSRASRLDILMPVPAGGEIVLEENARATLVVYRGNTTHALSGPTTVRVEEGGVSLVRGTPPQAKNISQAHAAVAVEGINRRLAMSAVALRKLSGAGGGLQLVQPSQDVALVSGEPELSWQAAPGALDREVVIQEMAGREVARLAAESDRLVVPRSAGLKPGTEYVWSVTAKFPGGRNETQERVFRILTQPDIDLIETLRPKDESDVASWVLYAAALEKFGAFDEARRIWRIVAAKNPGSERAKLIGN